MRMQHTSRKRYEKRSNKIEFRALNKNAHRARDHSGFLLRSFFYFVCAAFEFCNQNTYFQTENDGFVGVHVWICSLCVAMFLKCYGFGSALILNQLKYYDYVSSIRIHVMASNATARFLQINGEQYSLRCRLVYVTRIEYN